MIKLNRDEQGNPIAPWFPERAAYFKNECYQEGAINPEIGEVWICDLKVPHYQKKNATVHLINYFGDKYIWHDLDFDWHDRFFIRARRHNFTLKMKYADVWYN